MKKSVWFIITILYMALVAYLSLQPGHIIEGDKGKLEETIHNIGHIPAYAVMCCLWLISLGAKSKDVTKKLIVIAICISYGIFMEYLQSFVPHRYPSLMDVGSNTLGATLMAIFFRSSI